MVDACRKAGVSFTVHENFRFQRPMREVAGLLRDGSIGEPFFARISFRTPYDVFANQPYLATEERFIILDLGIHLLDLARCFMGDARDFSLLDKAREPEDPRRGRGHHGSRSRRRAHERRGLQLCDPPGARPLAADLVTIEGTKGTIALEADYRLNLTKATGSSPGMYRPRPGPGRSSPSTSFRTASSPCSGTGSSPTWPVGRRRPRVRTI
jgi:predicted dehydrogenase